MSWRDTLDQWERETKQPTPAPAAQPASTSSWRQAVEEIERLPPQTAGRRGGTRRELMGAYGAGQMAPGQVTPVTGPESLPALAAGVGRGVSGGITSYISPVFMSGPESYKEKLAEVRRIEEQVKQQYPVASGLGELTGATIGAGKAIKAASKVMPTAVAVPAVGGLYSGVSEATRPESTLGSVAGATALGATVAGAPAGLSKLAGSAKDAAVKKGYINFQTKMAEDKAANIQQYFEQAKPAIDRALQSPSIRGKAPSTDVILEKIAVDKVPGVRFTKEERNAVAKYLSGKQYIKVRQENIARVEPLKGEELTKNVKGSLSHQSEKDFAKEFGTPKKAAFTIKEALFPTGGAIAGGFGLPMLTEVDPLLGAAIGAGLGGGGRATVGALGSLLSGAPKSRALYYGAAMGPITGRTAGAMGAGVAPAMTPYFNQPQQPQMRAPIELPPIQQPTQPEVTDLDRLLERVRQTYGSQ